MFHELKTDLPAFVAVSQGIKTFEVRKNDRDFKAGDVLSLRCTQHTGEQMKRGAPLLYVGEPINVRVTHMLNGPAYGLAEGWCIMSIKFLS